MRAYARGTRRTPEDRRDLREREIVISTEHEHLTLRWRQRLHRRAKHLVVIFTSGFRRRHRFGTPLLGQTMFTCLTRDLLETHVARNAIDPRREPGVAAEGRAMAQHPKER